MAESQAYGPGIDSVPFSSLSHSGSVIDVEQITDTGRKRSYTVAIRCDGACVLTVKMANGQTRNISFAAGETRSLQVAKITAVVSGSPYPIEMIF